MKRSDFEIPEDFFEFDSTRPDEFPDNPEVRLAVDWFKSFIPVDEWRKRRHATAHRLYDLSVNGPEADDVGRLYDVRDAFAWQLFLAEASIDHVWNYEPTFGSRVVPLFEALGRNIEYLRGVAGIDERIRRIVGAERAQPNGPIFELLVAAAYARAGAKVAFVPEQPGGGRTHDIDAEIHGRCYAVECKRMETGDFGDKERAIARKLWHDSGALLADILRSVLASVEFHVPLASVPDDYMTKKIAAWLASGEQKIWWEDEYGRGQVGDLDLRPARRVLRDNMVLANGTRFRELLTGRYLRHQSAVSFNRIKPADNPRYIDDCDFAALFEWTPMAEASVSGRARDVLRKLVDGNGQLPRDRPGIIHVGFEAVDGDHVEQLRYHRIQESLKTFDPKGVPLEFAYVHFLSPESPPDQAWAFDETRIVSPIRPTGPPPLPDGFLIMAPNSTTREGPHWVKAGAKLKPR